MFDKQSFYFSFFDYLIHLIKIKKQIKLIVIIKAKITILLKLLWYSYR